MGVLMTHRYGLKSEFRKSEVSSVKFDAGVPHFPLDFYGYGSCFCTLSRTTEGSTTSMCYTFLLVNLDSDF